MKSDQSEKQPLDATSRYHDIRKLAGLLHRDRKTGEKFRKKRRRVIILLIVAVTAVVAYFIFKQGIVPVSATTVGYSRAGVLAETQYRSVGFITYPMISTIPAPANRTVQNLMIREGQRVVRGQAMAVLNTDDLTGQLRLREIALAANRQTAERMRNLFSAGAVSQSDLQKAETQLSNTEAEIKSLNNDIARATIRAPFSGLIIKKLVELGEFPLNGICRLADTSRTLVQSDISEADIGNLKMNQPAVVILDTYPDRQYAAEVYRIDPIADRAKNTVTVYVQIKYPDKLIKPNMSVRIYYVIRPLPQNQPVETVLAVDTSAVIQENNLNYVWIIRGGLVHKREIKTGAMLGSQVSVLSGLKENDRVVMNPKSVRLKESRRVNVH